MDKLETKRPKRKTERTHKALELETNEMLEAVETVTLEQAMNDFIVAKMAERIAPRTLKDYEAHFRYLRGWLADHHPDITFKKITATILREYVTWMTNDKEKFSGHHSKRPKPGVTGLSAMTVNIRIRTLKAFFNWCQGDGLLRVSPAADIKLQKVDEDKIRSFTSAQLKKYIATPDRGTYSGFRDYVIMMTLSDTALRISELLSLMKTDVDFKETCITVRSEEAKTRKSRTVPISKQVAKLLAELIRENEDFGPNANYLFYSVTGRRFTPDGFDERLKLYGEQAGIDEDKRSAHPFRHTFALHWIKRGATPSRCRKSWGTRTCRW
ncbi:tyrosine-type recombinase/integrase [Tumebacillus permanentifrigoris]|nr:tyrosine-type recombinase/integrase [Tumebacillus permanentifrigoris]